MEILIVIAFLALIIGGAILAHYQNAKRRTELAELAARLGWTFDPAKDYGMEQRYADLHRLQQGDNRYAYNILGGAHAKHRLCGFDYHYETYSTDSKGNRTTHNHEFSAFVLETGLPLRPLVIRPEGFFDRVGEFFGLDDIDFESHEFSRLFHVSSPDRRWAFDVIHQATMEFLLAAPRFTIEFSGGQVVVYRASCFSPSDYEDALRVTSGLIERLPNYLLREWKGAV